MEVLVVISEWGVIWALVAVGLPSEADVTIRKDCDVDWHEQKIVSWGQLGISGVGSNSSDENGISAVDIGGDLLVAEDGEKICASGVSPVISGVDWAKGIELRGKGISINEGDGEEREVDFGLGADI